MKGHEAIKPQSTGYMRREIKSGKSSQQTGIKETRTRLKETTNKQIDLPQS